MSDNLILAVSGGRYYDNPAHVDAVLDEEYAFYRFAAVVQGECPKGGADLLAKQWCRKHGIPCVGIEANFGFYGRPAGPIRNGWMFTLIPIFKLVAFPGNDGTADAIRKAAKLEILIRDERAE